MTDERLGWIIQAAQLVAAVGSQGYEYNKLRNEKTLESQRSTDSAAIDAQTQSIFGGTIAGQQNILSGKYTSVILISGVVLVGIIIAIPLLRR